MQTIGHVALEFGSRRHGQGWICVQNCKTPTSRRKTLTPSAREPLCMEGPERPRVPHKGTGTWDQHLQTRSGFGASGFSSNKLEHGFCGLFYPAYCCSYMTLSGAWLPEMHELSSVQGMCTHMYVLIGMDTAFATPPMFRGRTIEIGRWIDIYR